MHRPSIMFRLTVLAVLAVLTITETKLWNNPVLDGGDFPDPGVIYENGLFYAVTSTINENGEKFPIHSSIDLQNWNLEGYIFNQSNFPSYSKTSFEFLSPELHKIGTNNYRAYFTTRDIDTNLLIIGVATATNILGPYIAMDSPLLSDLRDVSDPTLVQDNLSHILVWRSGSSIWATHLLNDGLSFKEEKTYEILKRDLDWEGSSISAPWHFNRNGYHYLFYSANNYCSEDYVVGVARSKVSPIGPYEKKSAPILSSSDLFKGPGHGCVVPRITVGDLVFVYHGWKANEVCGSNNRVMLTSTIEWGDDGWPKNIVI